MRNLQLIDHTEAFNKRKIANIKSTSQNYQDGHYIQEGGQGLTQKQSGKIQDSDKRKIDVYFTNIDELIARMDKLVHDSTGFNFDTEDFKPQFDGLATKVNAISNNILTIIKRYETVDIVVHRYYVLKLKKKLEQVDKLTKRFFKKSDIISKYDTVLDNKNDTINDEFTGAFNNQEQESLLLKTINNHEALMNERAKNIMDLAKSINEVHQMFVDVQMMVNMQGEMLDKIDGNIFKSLDYVEEAKEELVKAHKNQTTGRKLKVGIIATLATVATLTGIGSLFFTKVIPI